MKTLAWHRLGEIPASRITGVVGFDGGYVAIGGDDGGAWFSPDGGSWKRVDAFGRAIATNGREVLVVGGYQHEPCGKMPPGSTGGLDCASSPVAWVSSDGVTWRKADLPPGDEQSELVAAWPVADGWVAAVSDWYGVCLGGSRLWRSADGISWEGYAPDPPAAWEGYEHAPLGVVGASGRVMLAASSRCDGQTTTLARLTDGGAWRVLRGLPAGAEVVTGAGPTSDRSRWVLGGLARDTTGCGEDEGDECGTRAPTIWSSEDGEDWTAVTLPVGPGVPASESGDPTVQVSSVTGLLLSDGGYVAVGVDGGSWADGARHETWVSDDGVDWAMLRQPAQSRFDYGPGLVADGPAGVVGFSGSSVEDETVVWQLQ